MSGGLRTSVLVEKLRAARRNKRRGTNHEESRVDRINSGTALLGFARSVIESAVRGGDAAAIPSPPAQARDHGGVFVTLRKFKRLRGCMGCLDGGMPVTEALRHAAVEATLRDPRFSPVAAGELQDIRIDVSIMSAPEFTDDPLSLEIGKHGILIQSGENRGLFLPSVARDHNLDAAAFLSRCCSEKSGLSADAWRNPETRVMLFTTEVLEE